MRRPNVFVDGPLGTFGVATRDPFAPAPEDGDPGVVGLLDLPGPREPLEKPDI